MPRPSSSPRPSIPGLSALHATPTSPTSSPRPSIPGVVRSSCHHPPVPGHQSQALQLQFDPETNIKIGRGRSGENVEQLRKVAGWCRHFGIKFKVNTVVCSLNWDEDMTRPITRFQPFRWKVFQCLIVTGETIMNSASAMHVRFSYSKRRAVEGVLRQTQAPEMFRAREQRDDERELFDFGRVYALSGQRRWGGESE
jgi:hypothetical protein